MVEGGCETERYLWGVMVSAFMVGLNGLWLSGAEAWGRDMTHSLLPGSLWRDRQQ